MSKQLELEVPVEKPPELIDTEEKAEAAWRVLIANPGAYVVDTETTGLTPYSAKTPSRICGFAVGWADTDEHDQYWSFRHAEGENLALYWLRVILQHLRGREVRGHNIKFDIHMMLVEPGAYEIPPKLRCSQIAAHTANENFQKYGLKELSAQLRGDGAVKASSELMAELRKRKAGKGEIYRLPAAIVTPYAIDDLRLCRWLLAWGERESARWGLTEWLETRYQYQLALLRIERRGMPISVAETERQIAELDPKIREYRDRLWRLQQAAGFDKPVNLNSPAQLKAWLKLKNTKKETLVEAIEASKNGQNPREDLQMLLDYRFATKAQGTYFDPFLERMDSAGRLHTSFRVTGTVTWRLSSTEPNLQNCSPYVKKCFVAPEGYKYVELDLSAIEPRLAAHYTQDPDLIASFWQGHDFHCTTAKMLFKLAALPDKESKSRRDAKTLGLGAIYRLGSHKMARALGLRHGRMADGTWERHEELVWALSVATGELIQKACSDQDAEFCTCAGAKMRNDFFYAIPTLKPTIDAVSQTARRNGYIRVPLFRTVQRFDGKRARNGWVKSFNALIQHTAAVMLMRIILAVDQLLGESPDCQMVGTIHDSIILLVRDDSRMTEHIAMVKTAMESQTKLRVPVVADVKIGHTLGNMHTWHEETK